MRRLDPIINVKLPIYMDDGRSFIMLDCDKAYILDKDKRVIEVHTSSVEYLEFKKSMMHRIKKTSLTPDIYVSTVFLNQGMIETGFFETMVFGGKLDNYNEVCNSYEEAIQQHANIIYKVLHAEGLSNRNIHEDKDKDVNANVKLPYVWMEKGVL